MEILAEREGLVMNLHLTGRLDSSTAPELEKTLKDLWENFSEMEHLVLDFENLEYVSSAGLRVLLMAQKRMGEKCDMLVTHVSRDIYDVFEMTGFLDILTVERKLRSLSIDGCERIGAGMCGECYKIDDETVLKLFFDTVSLQSIEQEKKYAQAAFLAGIPTAISFDMVECQGRRGLVFEMIHAQTLATVMKDDLDHLEEYAKKFAELSKLVHSTKVSGESFTHAAYKYEKMIDKMTFLTQAQHRKLKEMYETLPEGDTCVHGDYHTGNVMYQNGELMFIDMGDFSIGHPYFDVAQVYNLLTRDYANGLGETITKLDREHRHLFWKYFVKYYFGFEDEESIAEVEREIQRFDCIRQMEYIILYEATRKENQEYMVKVIEANM